MGATKKLPLRALDLTLTTGVMHSIVITQCKSKPASEYEHKGYVHSITLFSHNLPYSDKLLREKTFVISWFN